MELIASDFIMFYGIVNNMLI